MKQKEMRRTFIGLGLLGLFAFVVLKSCRTIPKDVVAVQPFDLDKYLGKWYEIARIDFKFEKDLNNTTAEYSLGGNGTVKVVNRGYNVKTNQWQEATGKAKRVSDEKAILKVSFFGPFYSGYNVIALDPEYRYALVCGKNHDYLWILSREKTIPATVREEFLQKATEEGFDVSRLIWVEHDR